MRIAVFIDDIYLSETGKDIKHVFLFEIDDRLIKALGEEWMRISDINYICIWLLGKRIKVVYSNDFTETEKEMLEKVDIQIRSLDEIRHNPLLSALLIK